MKKIGILVNSVGFGGNERSAVNIANSLRKKYKVAIITQEDCGNHYEFTGRVINLNTPCAKTRVGKAVNSLKRILRLRTVLRKTGIDTLFIILPITNPINYLKWGCRKVVSCRDAGDLIKNIDRYIKMTETSDLIVCNSEYQKDYLVSKAPHLKDKAAVVYNIIDVRRIQHLREEVMDASIAQFVSGHKFIVSTGRFADAKGLNNLIKAFSVLAKRDEDVRLVMIGDGELREKIENLIDAYGLKDRILLPGFDANPFKYIARANVFVLPSFYEGFPNTLVEAMSCGTPVISTDCPSGPAEILCGKAADGNIITETGILLKPFSEEETTWDAGDIRKEHVLFADEMERLLTDRELSEKLAKNALERVKDFTADKIANDWNEIL